LCDARAHTGKRKLRRGKAAAECSCAGNSLVSVPHTFCAFAGQVGKLRTQYCEFSHHMPGEYIGRGDDDLLKNIIRDLWGKQQEYIRR
jgi:hypothetical protein